LGLGTQEKVKVQTAENVKVFDPTVWVDLYGDYLFAFAFSRVRCARAAEDLVQETLLAALASYDSFAEEASEKTWLTGILKHKIIDHFRRNCRQFDLTAEESDMTSYDYLFAEETWKDHWTAETMPVEWKMTPEDALETDEFSAVLKHCLGELPERIASAFTLHEMDDLDAPQICEILQVSRDNFRVMLHRARTHLRRCLEYDWFRKVNL
jgi:RNA polymerase sigma-70 factor, ECF subfamily